MNNRLFINGKIYTGEARYPECEAVAVTGDRIVSLGRSKDLRNEFQRFEIVDLSGKRVLPAFTDSHTHFISYCLKQDQIDLNGIASLDECLSIIKNKIAQTPEGRWIKGSGWNQNLWSPAEYPTRKALDELTSRHPICLEARDAHTSWVNSLALQLAGIDATVTFDSTGQIVKDAQGNPTGIIKEEARRLVWDVMGEETVEERSQALMKGMKLAHANGLCAVHCMETIKDFETYQLMHERGELKVRVNFYLPIRHLDHVRTIGLKSGFGNEWIRFGGMKIFLDGTLGSQTAHMLAPFDNSLPGNCGTEIIDQETVNEYVLTAAQQDIACAIHAIGDLANRKALNAFENQKTQRPDKNLKQRIEHCQLIHPDDLSRFAKLGVIASMQAIHIPEDIDAANRYWGSRARWAYPFRSLYDSGAVVALGSDMPIETCNVFEGIYAALRRTKRGDDKPWYPEESLTLKEIISAYTMGPAVASGEESIKGSIAQGKLADMMILSDDIFECSSSAVSTIKVKTMIIGGKVVFDN